MNPDMTLLASALEAVTETLATDPGNEAAWEDARRALAAYAVGEEDDAELSAAVAGRDADTLCAIVAAWASGERLLLERDRAVLKRAMKAYRKRLKVTLLEAESSVSGGPMSAGRASSIVGIVPPDRYPRAVWDLLARQGRLVDDGGGSYGLPPGG